MAQNFLESIKKNLHAIFEPAPRPSSQEKIEPKKEGWGCLIAVIILITIVVVIAYLLNLEFNSVVSNMIGNIP